MRSSPSPDAAHDAARIARKERGIRSALTLQAAVLLGIGVTLTVLEITRDVVISGPVHGFTAILLALSTAPLLFAAALWLDRFEPEPIALLVRTLLWGAIVAVTFAGVLNQTVAALFGDAAAVHWAAPVFEEFLKGIAIVWIFTRRRDQFDGVLDGVVYALVVGLGFGIVEDFQYYMRAINHDGVSGLFQVWIMRGLATPFLHPFFTMSIGIAIGLAARPGRTRLARAALIAGGYLTAVATHAAWNSEIGLLLYPVFYLPVFVAVVVVLRRALRKQAHTLYTHLEPEVRSGLLEARDLEAMIRPRLELRRVARATVDGASTEHDEREVHRLAWLLATHRERTGAPTDADAYELELRAAIWARRDHALDADAVPATPLSRAS